jgi:hypothetical protein
VNDGPLRLVAIDPGDRHVGWATFVGVECTEVAELSPAECILRLEHLLQARALDVLVYESFALFPWEAQNQHWSEFETAQLIGVFKYLHARYGQGCELVKQPASIKKPAFAQLRARGIKSQAKRQGVPGQHVLDSEAHGWWYILKEYS